MSAVYHLLKGKRTSQTIQDGFLFQVHPYFATLPQLQRQDLQRMMMEFEKQNLIFQGERESFQLSERGKEQLGIFNSVFHIPLGLNGWFYGSMAKSFWKNTSLLVQTLSHLATGETQFHPVTHDEATLGRVKNFLLSTRMNRKDLVKALHQEIEQAWNDLPTFEADILAQRLSGFQFDGLSIAQLSEATGKSPVEVILHLQSGMHRLVPIILESQSYVLLKQLMDHESIIGLTESTLKTMEMLKKGLPLEDIAKFRHLKMTTIQDHVVEMAFCDPTFPIRPYVEPMQYQAVLHALKKVETRKLSMIKQHCPDQVDYFHIRLVLAREKMEWI